MAYRPDIRGFGGLALGHVAAAIVANLPSLLLSTSIVAPLATVLVNELKVDTDEAEPSSAEQFDRLFNELVDKSAAQLSRVVFFIDELDRAPTTTMRLVLETLRTFLDHPKCVFVVAADQIVLEESLESAETLPPSKQNPYYTSGSAYLDKIFQYQFVLPAVPPATLTRFALELTEGRAGIWEQLGDLRGDIVSLLVGGHVRSPRRVKVLLNNFSVAARVARDRLRSTGDAPPYARELAKLVALRTEFPIFYRDLEKTPTLADALTAKLLDDRGRLEELTKGRGIDDVLEAYASGRAAVDVQVRPVDESRGSRGTDLLDYLIRTSGVSAADRRLVYLEASGQQVGLPVEIAEPLSRAARNGDIDASLEICRQLDEATQRLAIRFIVQCLEEAVGIEIGNVLRVLSAVVEDVAADTLAPIADGVATSSLATDLVLRAGAPALPGLAKLAGLTSESVRDRSEAALLATESGGDEWIEHLLQEFGSFSSPAKGVLRELLTRQIQAESELPTRIAQSSDFIHELWEGPALRLIAERLSDEATTPTPVLLKLAMALLGSLTPTSSWRMLAGHLELDGTTGAGPLPELVEAAPMASERDAASIVIEAIANQAPLRAALAAKVNDQSFDLSDPLADALPHVLEAAASSDSELEISRKSVQSLSAVIRASTLVPATTMEAVPSTDWTAGWAAAAEAPERARLHRLVLDLASSDKQRTSDWADVVLSSLGALLTMPAITDESRQEFRTTLPIALGLGPSKATTRALFGQLSTARAASAGDTFSDADRKFSLLLVAQKLKELTAEERRLIASEARATVPGSGGLADPIHSIYLDVARPDVQEDLAIVTRMASKDPTTLEKPRLERYFASLSSDDAGELLVALFGQGTLPSPDVVQWLKSSGNQGSWARLVATNLKDATRIGQRRFAIEFAARLQIDHAIGQREIERSLKGVLRNRGSIELVLRCAPKLFPNGTVSRKTAREIRKAAREHVGGGWTGGAAAGLISIERLLGG